MNDTARPTIRLVRGRPASDGAGVRLTRVIGSPELEGIDPFLRLGEFRSDDVADYEIGQAAPDFQAGGF